MEGTGPGAQTEASVGGGTEVAGIALGSPDGVLEYDPSNPLADKQGMVRSANVNLGDQMSNMMMAQNGYEANLATISQAETGLSGCPGAAGMSILPVGAAAASMWPAAETTQVGLAEPTSPTSPTAPVGGAGAAGGASGGGDGFANVLGNALDSLSATQNTADNLATQAATGGLTNVADYMVAANEANIQTQLTSAVRNSALQSFQEIMGMQL